MHLIPIWLAGFALRAVEFAAEASLYLVIGLLTAGALRAMVPPDRLRAVVGPGRVTGPIRAWAAATLLLPTCALGVLPILGEFHRARVRRGAMLTFALAAPMLNPISLLSGLSYLGPGLLGVLLIGSACVSIGAGVLWGGPAPTDDEVDAPAPARSRGRIGAAFRAAALASTGRAAADVAAGLVVAAAIAAGLSESALASDFFAADPRAIPRMAAVAPGSYLSPDRAVVILPEMVKFDQSAGAMFALVALGAGMTAGHLAWAARSIGARAAIGWLLTVVALTLPIAALMGRWTPRVGTANPDNDHLAALANPFLDSGHVDSLSFHLRQLAASVGPPRLASIGALAALVAGGIALRVRGDQAPVERPEPADEAAPSPWNRPIPAPAARLVGGAAALAVACVGLYSFFPSPEESFADMSIIKADLFGEFRSAPKPTILHHLDLWERRLGRLRVGAAIRLRPTSAEARSRTESLSRLLGLVRAAVEQGRIDQAHSAFLDADKGFGACKAAYLGP